MKQFILFRRPKNEDAMYSIPDNNKVFGDFKNAIDAMNRVLRSQNRNTLPPYLSEQVLCVELNTEWMELWKVERPEADSASVVRLKRRPVRMDDKIY